MIELDLKKRKETVANKNVNNALILHKSILGIYIYARNVYLARSIAQEARITRVYIQPHESRGKSRRKTINIEYRAVAYYQVAPLQPGENRLSVSPPWASLRKSIA